MDVEGKVCRIEMQKNKIVKIITVVLTIYGPINRVFNVHLPDNNEIPRSAKEETYFRGRSSLKSQLNWTFVFFFNFLW